MLTNNDTFYNWKSKTKATVPKKKTYPFKRGNMRKNDAIACRKHK